MDTNQRLIQNLTIVIPSHNRPQYLKRITGYFSKLNATVVVVDSTKQPFAESLPDNTQYFHRTDLDLPRKLLFASQYVETPLVVICADDDFITPQGLVAAIEFLQCNEDYVSCQGLTMSYLVPEFGKLLLAPKYEPLALSRLQTNFADGDPAHRLISHFSTFMQWVYAVHRTEAYTHTVEILCGVQTLHRSFVDRIVSFGLAVQGNLKLLPLFFSVREQAPMSIPLDQKFCVLMEKGDKELDKDFSDLNMFLDNQCKKRFGVAIGVQYIEKVFSTYCDCIKPENAPHKPEKGRLTALRDENGKDIVLLREFSEGLVAYMESPVDYVTPLLPVYSSVFSNYSDDILAINKYLGGKWPEI